MSVKMCPVSILGGGVARDLLKGLEGKAVGDVSHCDLPQASFSLRQSYQHRRGKWDGCTYVTRREATGGLLAWADVKGFYASYSKLHRRQVFRIRPGEVPKAQERLNRWVTALVRSIGAERYRVQAVEQLDKLCTPLVQDPTFMSWVEQQEKVWGESDYQKLSIEDCAKWIDGIRQWCSQNKKPFNINPSGQAGMGWVL